LCGEARKRLSEEHHGSSYIEKIVRHRVVTSRRWTGAEELKLNSGYESGKPITAIASDLNRSVNAIEVRASALNVKRPAIIKWHRDEITWESNSPTPLQEPSSGRGFGVGHCGIKG
jgi:hypothetical protein